MAAPTLTQYLLDVGDHQDGHDYAHVMSAVAVSVKLIAASVSRGPLIVPEAAEGDAVDPRTVNQQLREIAASILLDQVSTVRQLAAISLLGIPGTMPTSSPYFSVVSSGPEARYLLVVEALHGAMRLAENQSVGLCFSILERPAVMTGTTADHTAEVREDDFLQEGSQQLCAGLALFGPSTVLVLTTGDGVDGFTLDRDVGNFVLTHPQMIVPATTSIVALNPTGSPRWPAPIKRYVEECLLGSEGPRGEDFVLRWNASAVMGAFRVLMNGGVFIAPELGERDGGNGLPLLHTCAPLAFIIEQAGGAAIDSTQRMLNCVPSSAGQRAPIIFGAVEEVSRIRRYFLEHEKGYDTELTYPLFHNRSLFAQQ